MIWSTAVDRFPDVAMPGVLGDSSGFAHRDVDHGVPDVC
jgi:hypothetical protein